MTEKQAMSWLSQPGIKTTMMKYDKTTNEAIKIAIKALKKQMPISYKIKYKETIEVQLEDQQEIVDVFTFHCPCCDMECGDSDWDGHPDGDWLDYCEKCGQKIDWIHDVELPEFERIEPKKTKLGPIYGERI